MARLAFYTQTYNGGNFLARAIESVLNQTFSDFVYYIVDDASTDDSVEIIKAYSESDSRIIPYFAKENKIMGHYIEYLDKIVSSDAEYLCFLDHDDWYESSFAALMIDKLDNYGIDLAICRSDYISESTMNVIGQRVTCRTGLYYHNDYETAYRSIHQLLRPLWGKIYRCSVFRENEIKFRDDLTYGMDTVFVFDFLHHARGMYVDGDTIQHHYLMRTSSISRAYTPKRFKDDIWQYNHSIEWLNSMKARSVENENFLVGTLLLAINTSNSLIMAAPISDKEKLDDIICALSFPTISKQLITDANNLQTLNFKKNIVNFINILPSEIFMEQKYTIAGLICPQIREVLNFEQFCIAYEKQLNIITQFITNNFDGLSESLGRMEGHILGSSSYFTSLLTFLIRKNEILSSVIQNIELINYPKIIDSVFRKRYTDAGQMLYYTITSNFDKKDNSLHSLIDLNLYVSALNEDDASYIFSKKALLTLLYNEGDRVGFDKVYDEIISMIPEDADVKELISNWTSQNSSQKKIEKFNCPRLSKKNKLDSDFYELINHIKNHDTYELLQKATTSAYQLLKDDKTLYDSLSIWYKNWYGIQSLSIDDSNFVRYFGYLYEYLRDNASRLIMFYENLCDNRSKYSLMMTVQHWFTFSPDFRMRGVEHTFPHYFDLDLITCNEDEVFVDCGAFNGDSIVDFIKMYGTNYKRVYGYELTPKTFSEMEGNLKNYKNIVLRNVGVYSQNTSLPMYEIDGIPAGNRLSQSGTVIRPVVSLDEDIHEKITFIKMDVEGAEPEALTGAKNHLQKDHPKLAISLYHSINQLLDIPELIHSIDPSYKFYFRHCGAAKDGLFFPTKYILIGI